MEPFWFFSGPSANQKLAQVSAICRFYSSLKRSRQEFPISHSILTKLIRMFSVFGNESVLRQLLHKYGIFLLIDITATTTSRPFLLLACKKYEVVNVSLEMNT